MVLHGDNGSFDIESAVGAPQAKLIGELEGRVAGKENFAGRAELDNDAFSEIWGGRGVRLRFRLMGANHFHWHAHRAGIEKKARQLCNAAGVRLDARCGCALIGQFCPDFVPRCAGGLPHFPVRKSYWGAGIRGSAEDEAKWQPSQRTEGLALRWAYFQQVRDDCGSCGLPGKSNLSQGETSVSIVAKA